MGVLVPSTTPGTGGIKAEIPVTGTPNYIATGPTSGTYADSMWFSVDRQQTDRRDRRPRPTPSSATSRRPTRTPTRMALGPDGNLWFTSGTGNPPWVGAVVLNPADLGTQVVVTTQPPNVEETFFGGYNYSFGFTVAVENSAGQIDPFVQQGTITIALNDPTGSNGTLQGEVVTLPVSDGLALFDGLIVYAPSPAPTTPPARATRSRRPTASA